jgi:Signal transduction histidine kinase regulating citrate/malate metabolism
MAERLHKGTGAVNRSLSKDLDAKAVDSRRVYRIHMVAVALLGFTTLLFTGLNMRFLLSDRNSGEVQLSLFMMGIAILIAVGVIVVTSYVIKMVKNEVEIRLEVERLQSKADLVDSLREVRHDFDNQLTVILALLQLGRVERAIDYLRGIVGRGGLAPEGQGPGTLFAFLAEKGLQAVEKEIAIQFDLTPFQMPDVPIDAITRIVGNLFDNAVEAASKALDPGQVKVKVGAGGGRWFFEIWNNGASIPPHMIDRVFDSGVTTKREGEGHGLGLAVVRRLVDAHQGEISVQSDPRLGTTFRVSFEAAFTYSEIAQNR